MGRWTQYDEVDKLQPNVHAILPNHIAIQDSYRLPEGFIRVGYGADTQQYTYSDRSGNAYQGAPGAEYGTLEPVSSRVDLKMWGDSGCGECKCSRSILSLKESHFQ